MCTAVCLVLASGVAAETAHAQASGPPPTPPVGSSAAVQIAGMFLLSPSAPVLTPTDSACGDARCFEGMAVVRANQPWQLQVRVDPGARSQGGIEWQGMWEGVTGPTATRGSGALVIGASWVTVARGATPTAGTAVPMRVRVLGNATETWAGRSEAMDLSAALQFRVIGGPSMP